jgi:hypothetical protein
VRAGLLARMGDVKAAGQAYELAVGLEPDAAVRAFLQRRCNELRQAPAPAGGLKIIRPTQKTTSTPSLRQRARRGSLSS